MLRCVAGVLQVCCRCVAGVLNRSSDITRNKQFNGTYIIYVICVLQCDAVCCGVFQNVAVCFYLLQVCCRCGAVCCSASQCVAVCCSVLQCVAVCCSVLLCVAGVLPYVADLLQVWCSCSDITHTRGTINEMAHT